MVRYARSRWRIFSSEFSPDRCRGMLFQLLNFTGGVALVIFAISKKAMQLAILNTFWALIGAAAIIRLFCRHISISAKIEGDVL